MFLLPGEYEAIDFCVGLAWDIMCVRVCSFPWQRIEISKLLDEVIVDFDTFNKLYQLLIYKEITLSRYYVSSECFLLCKTNSENCSKTISVHISVTRLILVSSQLF